MARRGRSPGLTGGPGHPDNARVRAWMTLCVASTFGTLSRHPVCNIPSATVWRNWMASICGPRQLFFVVISLPLPLRPKREKVGECGADEIGAHQGADADHGVAEKAAKRPELQQAIRRAHLHQLNAG